MDNHNRSKKHAENVSRLLQELGDDSNDDDDDSDNRENNDDEDDDSKLNAEDDDDVELADDLPDTSQSR